MMKHYITLLLMITGSTILFAAPGNDNCANAIALTVNPTCSFTSGTVDLATQSALPATCAGLTSLTAFDVWYKFTAGTNGQIITVKGSASFDAVIILMDGCSGAVVDCSDNSGFGGTEMLNANGLTSGNVYYIRIYHYGNALPTTPTFDICVSLPSPPPSNDECVNAITLTVDSICTPTPGTISGATQSGPSDSCSSYASLSAFDVWYKFIATATNNVITVQGALSFDAVITLKDSCNGAVFNCADNSFSGGIETINDTNLIVGNTYYVRVYSYGNAIPSTPDFDICVSLPAPPPLNDNCANAILLNVDSLCNFIPGTVAGATESMSPDSCPSFASAAAYDVWYKFVANPNGQTITVKGSESFDAIVSLRNSCSGAVIDCSDNSYSGGTERINTNGLTPGNTYYIRVYSYGSALPSTPEFEICVALPPPIPVNDECNNAITLSVDSTCNYTSGTVAGSTESGPADICPTYASSGAYDVWYKFIATAANNTVTVKGSLSFDAVVVLKDSCSGSTINCSDNTGSEGIEIVNGSGLIIGNTYYVRVYAYGSAQPSTLDFEICVSIPPPPPVNDDCTNAISLTANTNCSYMAGTVTGATQSAAPESCAGFSSPGANDVWYKFVAVASNQTIMVKGTEFFDAIVVLTDSCGGAPIGCADSAYAGGTEVIYANSLIIGNTYYIRVYAYGSTIPETPKFDICLLDSGPMSVQTADKDNYSVNVFPNPASNIIMLTLKSPHNSEGVHYKIINVNGQEVGEGWFVQNSLQKEVDISSLTSGVYNIQISIAETIINKKIVVMNK